MYDLDLCWDETGRNVVLKHGCASPADWPFALFHLGSARVEARALSAGLRTQLEMFGSAPLDAGDERTIVARIGQDDARMAA